MALRGFRIFLRPGAAVRADTAVLKAHLHSSSPRPLRYGWWAYALGERTTPRLGKFSRIISVDGNLVSGKGQLGHRLADRLGMLYMPEPDCSYVDRRRGPAAPLPSIFTGKCSLERFYSEPRAADGHAYRLQLWMYTMRLLQYADALEHLLSTGQGVVLERSPFSDMVFMDAMFKEGYIRKECVQHYNEIKGISICEFLPPHLVIYIDQPAEDVHKALGQSDKSYLQAVPLSYLKSIEDSYKKNFLPEIRQSSELLVYDVTQAQDVERVAEDIDYLTFDKGPWTEQDDVSYHHMRMLVEDKHQVVSLTVIPRFLPEITVGAHEFDHMYYHYRSLPGKKYAEGYNADVGDRNIWLK